MLEKNDNFKQRRITEMFSVCSKENLPSTSKDANDIEDFGKRKSPKNNLPIVSINKRKRSEEEFTEDDLNKTWREVLGKPPSYGNTKVSYFKRNILWLILTFIFFPGTAVRMDSLSKEKMEISSFRKSSTKTYV